MDKAAFAEHATILYPKVQCTENWNMHKCSPNNNLSSIQLQGYVFTYIYFIYISKKTWSSWITLLSMGSIHFIVDENDIWNSINSHLYSIKYKVQTTVTCNKRLNHLCLDNVILFSSETSLNMKIYGYNDKVDFDLDKQMWTRWLEVKISPKELKKALVLWTIDYRYFVSLNEN